MWSNGPFAKPVSSFEAPVPPVGIDPTNGPFVYVAINEKWIPYVIGSLFQLLLQTTWDTDDPDTLDLAQLQAFNLIQQFQVANNQCPAGSVPTMISEMAVDMSVCEQLRFSQQGKLQGLCCGMWTDIPGQLPGSTGGTLQPGPGEPQPAPGGGCQIYHAELLATGAWNAPTSVSAGDVITVSNALGATYDGTYSSWRCWDGNTFFLGACIPATNHPVSSDPDPALKHMHLIGEINGLYFSTETPFTVPPGVTDAALNFQVNDSVLTDNGGSLSFDVQVCNNSTTTFTHTFDFKTSTHGFVNVVDATQSPDTDGLWLPNLGWDNTTAAIPPHEEVSGTDIFLTFPSTQIMTAVMIYDLTKGTFTAGPPSNAINLFNGGTFVVGASVTASTDPDGNGKALAIAAGTYTVDKIELYLRDAFWETGGAGAAGAGTIVSVVVTGLGPDPFVSF